MKSKSEQKRRKTFPLEIEENLHKALKHKAIEADQTLHNFIIETLSASVQEEPAQYGTSFNESAGSNETKR